MKPRSRWLRPGYFKSEELADLDFADRYCFAGLWLLADREGRLENRPRQIKVYILPYDDLDVSKILQRLHEKGIITLYEIDGMGIIQVNNFLEHQRPHHKEEESQLPAPTQLTLKDRRLSQTRLKVDPTFLQEQKQDQARKQAQKQKQEQEVEGFVQLYHATCSELPCVKKVTPSRASTIVLRLKELSEYKLTPEQFLQKVADSDWLSGRSKEGWKANLDWILQPRKFLKIIEGFYDNTGKTRNTGRRDGQGNRGHTAGEKKYGRSGKF